MLSLLALLGSFVTSTVAWNQLYATYNNFASGILNDDGLPPHPLNPYQYGTPVYPTLMNGKGREEFTAKVSYFEGKYYLYGSTWGCGGTMNTYIGPGDFNWPPQPVYPIGDYGSDGNCGVKIFESEDMTNWVQTDFFHPDVTVANVTKPVVRYSKAINKYVMMLGGGDQFKYTLSNRPGGPFQGLYNMSGLHLTHDYDIINGPNDTYWIVSDVANGHRSSNTSISIPLWDTYIQQLKPDLSGTVNTSSTVFLVSKGDELALQDLYLEAIGGFYREGKWYITMGMTCQNCPGYIYYYYADSPSGPWTLGSDLAPDGCGGQSKGVSSVPAVGGIVYIAHVLFYRTGPLDFIHDGGNWHADNQQAISTTLFLPLEFNDDGTIKPYVCAQQTKIPLVENATSTPEAPDPYILDCRIRAYSHIVQSYSPAKEANEVVLPVFQRTYNLGPTTNAGPVLDGPLFVSLHYEDGGVSANHTWAASNISWTPDIISIPVEGRKVSAIEFATNASNGCYGTLTGYKNGNDSDSSLQEVYTNGVRSPVDSRAEVFVASF